MYTKEQKERALKEYERLGSVQATITYLGYPSRHTLYDWYRNMLANKQDYHGSPNKPFVHTDRGCHYRWTGWIKRMEAAELTRSMSKKGCSPDNAACEGFFGRLKNEMFYGRSWICVSMEDFINEINDYITWYNTKRIKQSLGYMSPVEYRHNLGLAA